MKNCASLILAALLAWIFTGCSRHSAKTIPQPVTFSGFTKGYVGAFAPAWFGMNTNRAAVFQKWLADGTNCALFTITNRQSCEIVIYSVGHIYNAGTHPTNAEIPILNVLPDFSGIRLKPGQVSTIQVPALPHETPWRMEFSYYCTDQRPGFMEVLRARIFRTPAHVYSPSITIESDLINQ